MKDRTDEKNIVLGINYDNGISEQEALNILNKQLNPQGFRVISPKTLGERIRELINDDMDNPQKMRVVIDCLVEEIDRLRLDVDNILNGEVEK